MRYLSIIFVLFWSCFKISARPEPVAFVQETIQEPVQSNNFRDTINPEVRNSVILSEVTNIEGEISDTELNVPDIIFSHIDDSYEWHISKFGSCDVAIHLPVILYSRYSGVNVFSSKKLEHGSYKGFFIAADDSRYKGKIIEMINGEECRPFDISITFSNCIF